MCKSKRRTKRGNTIIRKVIQRNVPLHPVEIRNVSYGRVEMTAGRLKNDFATWVNRRHPVIGWTQGMICTDVASYSHDSLVLFQNKVLHYSIKVNIKTKICKSLIPVDCYFYYIFYWASVEIILQSLLYFMKSLLLYK